MTERNMSRRAFIGGAALTGAGLAGGVLSGCSAAGDTQSAVADDMKWDKEVDMVVIGSGTAAWGAAVAASQGLSVVVIEKDPVRFGGTSSICSGAVWLPQNYLMKENGEPDNREEAISYMQLISCNQVDDKVIESFVDNSPKFAEWQRDNVGVPWILISSLGRPVKSYVYEDRPGGTICRSVLLPASEDADKPGGGGGIWKMLKDKIDSLGVETLMGTAGTKLYTDGQGAVIGCQAVKDDGSTVNIRADKGILVGTGGFDHNENFRNTFLKVPIMNTCAVEGNTGDSITMGLEVGADLGGMSNVYGEAIWIAAEEYSDDLFLHNLEDRDSTFSPRSNPNSIIVNKYGNRIGNESSAYSVFNRAYEQWDTGHCENSNIPGYFIADSTYTEHYVLPLAAEMYKLQDAADVGTIPEEYVVANTLEELADKLGIDKEGLTHTVAKFNEYCANGKDYDFARGESFWGQNVGRDQTGRTDLVDPALGPVDNPPYYGVIIAPGSLGTSGGLKIDENAQVLDRNGQPIQGLYACGCAAASVYGPGYPGSGAPIASGSVMAYVAANHIATS